MFPNLVCSYCRPDFLFKRTDYRVSGFFRGLHLERPCIAPEKDRECNRFLVFSDVVAPVDVEELNIAQMAKEKYEGKAPVTVVPDAYTDFRPEDRQYPDYTNRCAIARHIAFCYNGGNASLAISAINEILRQISDEYEAEGINTLEDLLKYLNLHPLKIKPIDYTEIDQWRQAQKEILTAL